MSKKDVIEILVGCVAWAIVLALVFLSSLGIVDLEVVLNILYRAIGFLGISLVLLLFLWVLFKK